jgi:DNA-directed RNA polymerase subunit N (RpoN/RPB10)
MHEITGNIEWEFSDKKVTPWGGMRVFKEFLDRSGIREQLRVAGLPEPMSNCGYDPVMLMESFWVTVWLGGVRFSHTAIVRFDDALKDIFGWKRVPCVSTYTRFFKRFQREEVDNIFGNINQWFFSQMPARNFTVDLDSSVMTRYGQQEGSAVGYNPQKRGRRSHHPLMAFIADLRMVAHSWLRPGNTSSANGVKTFLSETIHVLGKHRIGLLRADAGFFDGGFLEYIESKELSYIVAVKMNRIVKEKIVSPGSWIKLDGGIDCAEFEYKAQCWQKPRRVVVVRQLVKERPQAGGKYLFDMHDYRYQAWSTNLTLPAAEVWRLYRGRADAENRIEELKYDFGLDSFCLDQFYATEAAFRSVMVAYNMISLFRQAVLGVKIQPRLATIRFQCFAIGSWIGRKYRRNVLRVSLAHKRRPWFEGLFTKIEDFSWDLPIQT